MRKDQARYHPRAGHQARIQPLLDQQLLITQERQPLYFGMSKLK